MKRNGIYKSYLKRTEVTFNDIPRQTRYNKHRRQNDGLINVSGQDNAPHASNESGISLQNVTVEITDSSESNSEEDGIESENGHSESSESDMEDQENTTHNKTDEIPLFPGAKINSTESMLLIFAFSARHKLTKVAVHDLIELIEFHMPPGASSQKSNYKFKKSLNFDYSAASTYYYCPTCQKCTEENSLECVKCKMETGRTILRDKNSFFISFNIIKLLDEMLGNETIINSLEQNIQLRKKQTPDISSIFDGKCYQDLKLGENDLTCLLNTDGIPVFKSSNFSLWPILCSLNELDYDLRRKHTMTLGLWFGPKKPNFDLFFEPFVKTSKLLSSTGVQWNYFGKFIKSKVFFPILVCDSIARPQVQGLLQFNGHYGCTWCLSEGKSLKMKDTASHKWVYPPEAIPSGSRSKTQFIGHLKELEKRLTNGENIKSHFGIKAASKLLLLPNFDIINGLVFDYMHTGLLGISRTFLNLWLDSRKHKENYYIGTKSHLIDNKLLACLVPSSFDRCVRSISNRKYWKANEWRTWTYVSCIILNEILPDVYLNHFLKFVKSLMILCSESISPSDLTYAETQLNSFVSDTKDLYGEYYCTYNVHLMCHAVQSVKNWGPLYCYSAFQFEHFNGILLGLFQGTRQIPTQISNHIMEICQSYRRQNDFQNMLAKEFYNVLLQKSVQHKNVKRVQNFVFFGSSTSYQLNSDETRELVNRGLGLHVYAQSFKNVIINCKLFNIFSKTTSKRCNCVISANKKYYIIRNILVFPDTNTTPVVLVSEMILNRLFNKYFTYSVTRIQDSTKFFFINRYNTA